MPSRSIAIRWNGMKTVDMNLPKLQKRPMPSLAECTKLGRGGSRVTENVMVVLVDNKLSIN